MKKSLLFIVIFVILALLAGAGWWFWSLGSVATAAEAPAIRLTVEKGSVFVTKAGSGDESAATNGMTLATGDRVRTDKNSAATVDVFGRAETRLDQNTTLVLDEATTGSATSMAVRWKIEAGRTWSRVLRLLDLDSTYEVHSDQVVATVRGTAFMVWKDKDRTGVYVDQAGVRVQSLTAADQERSLVAGEWIAYGADGKIDPKDATKPGAYPLDAWIAENKKMDEAFLKRASQGLFDSLRASGAIAFDSSLRPLADLSERLHLALAGRDEPELYAAYLGQKLGFVRLMIERGQTDRAASELDRIETNFAQRTTAAAFRAPIRGVIARALLSASDVLPGDPLYAYKLRLEKILADVYEPAPSAEGLVVPPFVAHSRLEEAEKLTCEQLNQETVDALLSGIQQAWTDEETGMKSAGNSINADVQKTMSEKFAMQKVRLDRFYARLKSCQSTAASTSTEAVPSNEPAATSTAPIKPSAPIVLPKLPTFAPINVKTTQPPVSEPTLTKIELYAQPNPVTVGDKAALYVKGYAADGSALDVTSRAKFNLIGQLGTLNGAAFLATGAGSVTIEAQVASGNQTLSSRLALVIQQPVTLTGLKVTSRGGTQVVQGSSVALTATAQYSSGATRDVTSDAKWGLTSGSGSVSGNVFTAGANQTGQAEVTAYYGEGGVSVSGSAILDVVPLTATAPLK